MRFKMNSKKPVMPELAAGKDASRPVLTTVYLNTDASEVWVTDSYMAARFPVELDEGDTSGAVPVEALKAYRKPPLKYYGDNSTHIALNGAAEVYQSREWDGGSEDQPAYLTVPRPDTSDMTFPDLARLFPDSHAEFEIGLSAKKLYDLARALGDETVRLRFSVAPNSETNEPSPLRPIQVAPLYGKHDPDAPSGILTPIRLA